MTRYVRGSSKKLGLPPGALVFVGEKKTENVRIRVIDYDGQKIDERTLASIEEVFAFKDTPTVSWVNIDGVHDVEVIRQLGERYGLHPLVLEDIVSTGQRPKVEAYDDYLFIVVKMLYFDENRRKMTDEQVAFVMGSGYVLSFQERPGDIFEPVRERLRSGKGRLRTAGSDYLAYALLDVIVDHYFVVLEDFSALTEELEEVILAEPSPETQQKIRDLRRELIAVRRAVWPVRELVSSLERTDSPLLSAKMKPFFRDIYDHSVQVIDIVESLRDVLSGLMDLYMSSLGNRMNEIMKFLTIIGTIFIPLTFLAGIYGMNFEYMPELHWRLAYPVFLATLIVIGLVLLFYFRRKQWL